MARKKNYWLEEDRWERGPPQDEEAGVYETDRGMFLWQKISLATHTHSSTGGVVHYDYVVDSSYTGSDGDAITLATGAIVNLYTTVQAAITAAEAENADITILINEGANAGVYNEAVTIAAT